MSMTVFTEEIKLVNIGISNPRKDQCDLCCEYKQGNCSDITYQEHRTRKKAAQREKEKQNADFCGSRTNFFLYGPTKGIVSPFCKCISFVLQN